MNTIAEIIQHEIYTQLAAFSLLNTDLLIAFSGGPDSAVLLDAVSRLSDESEISGAVHAVYINHGLRTVPELEKEESFIHDFCRNRSVPVSVIRLGASAVQDTAAAEKTGIEAAARKLRYQALEKCAAQHASAVLTAHNQDDQIETVIMRFFQGSGAEGLRGIPERRGIIYRPMLRTAKKDIYRYLKERNLDWSVDSTNEETVYDRNRLRTALELFERLFPGYRQSVLSLSEKMRMAASMSAVTKQEMECAVVFDTAGSGLLQPVRASLRTAECMKLPPYKQMNMLYAVWNRIRGSSGFDNSKLPFRDVRAVLETCSKLYAACSRETHTGKQSERHSGGRTVLGRMDLTESRMIFLQDEIIWERVVVPGAENGYLKVVHADEADSVRKQLYGQACFQMFTSRTFAGSQSALIFRKTAFPVLVRSAVPGDFIRTQSGTKYLKDLFSSWHVPREERWKIPVIEDSCGIQAVLGKYLGYSDRVSSMHRIQKAACGEAESAGGKTAGEPSVEMEKRFLVCSIHQFGDDIEQ